jgi:predicted kinase
MYVLVGGWPASGKSTVARALGRELDLAYLGKDEVKEALMDALGAPSTVEQSKTLGVAAVHAVLRVARDCPGAVIDSTWYDYSVALVEQLPGPLVEVRCLADRETVRARYRSRVRDARHLDGARTEEELWARAVAPPGVGPLVEVDTTRSVDIVSLADRIRSVVRT